MVDQAGTGSPAESDEPFVSLYRRFRPGRFGELRGQPHVVLGLQSAVRDQHVAHAYLFSGPRGTGKTSTARILARALNCADPQDGEPCGVCPSCVEIARGTSLDVHELDAASNNGVDAIRDLISHAALGTPGRRKVYIVDEVHMLSNAAANALLKTLEEPPAHVVFVLATTDPQKVPPTIRSRTQHFEFRLLGADTLGDLLHEVNQAAGLALDDDALAVAVRRGRGSARDALSVLDQVAASGSADDTRPEVAELVEAIEVEDAGRALVVVAALHEAGWGAPQLAAELVDELRQAFLAALAPELGDAGGEQQGRLAEQAERLGLPRLVRCIETLGRTQVDMREAPDPRVALEVALVRLARPELDDSAAALDDRLSRLERAMAAGDGSGPAPAAHPPVAAVSPASSTRPTRPAGPATPPSTPVSSPSEPRPPVSAPPTSEGASTPPTAEARPSAGSPAVPGAADPATRPGLGALRRQLAAQAPSPGPDVSDIPLVPTTGEGSPAVAEPAEPFSTGLPSPEESPPPADRAPAPGGSLDWVPAPPSGGIVAGHPEAAGGLDRDLLVQVWGDHILRSLPARAKALYSGGRFVTTEDRTAVFALPNAAHRDRCQDLRSVVEAAVSAQLGGPVTLDLVIDGSEPAGGPGAASSGPVGTAPSGSGGDGTVPLGVASGSGADEGDDEFFDPEELSEAVPVESVAEAKVLEAFPGAEEV